MEPLNDPAKIYPKEALALAILDLHYCSDNNQYVRQIYYIMLCLHTSMYIHMYIYIYIGIVR